MHTQMSHKHTVEFGVRGAAGIVCIGRCFKLQKNVMELMIVEPEFGFVFKHKISSALSYISHI